MPTHSASITIPRSAPRAICCECDAAFARKPGLPKSGLSRTKFTRVPPTIWMTISTPMVRLARLMASIIRASSKDEPVSKPDENRDDDRDENGRDDGAGHGDE